MLNKILSFADYKFLKVLASHANTQSSAPLETYDAVDFKDAPNDTLLLVMSNRFSNLESFNINNKSAEILSGSIVVKLSDDTIMQSGLSNEEGKGLVYFDTVQASYGSGFESIDRQVGRYDVGDVNGKVALISSDSVRNMLYDLDDKYLNSTFDVAHYVRNAINYKKVVTNNA